MIVLPARHLLAGAMAEAGINIDPDAVPRAHYRAVRTLDRAAHVAPASPAAPASRDYAAALLPQLKILPGQAAEALAVWERLADRRRSRAVLWSEPTPNARATIEALRRAGIVVVVVTNSDGHAAANLADSGFGGLPVIDSEVVGARKPDVGIFHAALGRAGVPRGATVHVGDTLRDDVAGARAAGITPIHFDPLRACRDLDHRHIRTLAGIWRHITPRA